MAFYLRKSLSFGPLRLNLSKSGLGISAGVKGLRVGTGPRGAYVHGGRHGLYFRQPLRSSSSSSARAAAPPVAAPSPRTPLPKPSLELNAPADFSVMLRPGASAEIRARVNRYRTPMVGTLIVGGLVTVAVLNVGIGWGVLVATATVGAAAILRNADVTYGKRLQSYCEKLLAAFKVTPPLPASAVESLVRRRQTDRLDPEHLRPVHREVFRGLLEMLLEDGHVADEERELLARAQKLLELHGLDIGGAKREAFLRHYVAAIADHELTDQEEDKLGHLRDALQVPDAVLTEELKTLATMREVQRIRRGQIEPVAVDWALQKGEACYYAATAEQLEKRVLRSYTENRVRYKEEGMITTKVGTLYVTTERLAMVADGVTSYRLDRIIDIEVDADRNIIILTLDKRAKPVGFFVPNALIVGAYIDRLAGRS